MPFEIVATASRPGGNINEDAAGSAEIGQGFFFLQAEIGRASGRERVLMSV